MSETLDGLTAALDDAAALDRDLAGDGQGEAQHGEPVGQEPNAENVVVRLAQLVLAVGERTKVLADGDEADDVERRVGEVAEHVHDAGAGDVVARTFWFQVVGVRERAQNLVAELVALLPHGQNHAVVS